MLIASIKETLSLLQDTLTQLPEGAYAIPVVVLSGGTIGQHVRHIAEMYVCLFEGLPDRIVCYERRRRDKEIEKSKLAAITLLAVIIADIDKSDCNLVLDTNYELCDMAGNLIPTSYFRELAYNLEHTIHHMAFIRIGIEANSSVSLAPCFGVAPSTIRHRNEAA
jgi:hypothetical protein